MTSAALSIERVLNEVVAIGGVLVDGGPIAGLHFNIRCLLPSVSCWLPVSCYVVFLCNTLPILVLEKRDATSAQIAQSSDCEEFRGKSNTQNHSPLVDSRVAKSV